MLYSAPMSFRKSLHHTLSNAYLHMLSRPWFPLSGAWRSGRVWLYDICGYARTRNLRVLFDVGANTGQTALAMHRFFPEGQIHSFEMISDTAETLRQNTAAYGNIHVHQLALGSEPGRVKLKKQACSELNSLAHRVEDATADGKFEEVQVTTLDDFCAEKNISRIDVLKIDAEGFDLEVLRGAERLLSGKQVCFVFAEVTFRPDRPGNQPYIPLHEHLIQKGFYLSGFYDQWRRGPAMDFCNALFVHPEALKLREK